jgi:hypothetical protein
MIDEKRKIMETLKLLQAAYRQRNPANAGLVMSLFSRTHRIEVIGANGLRPGIEEWCTSSKDIRDLLTGDWKSWGKVDFKFKKSGITIHENTGWIASSGLVKQLFDSEENMRDFLE